MARKQTAAHFLTHISETSARTMTAFNIHERETMLGTIVISAHCWLFAMRLHLSLHVRLASCVDRVRITHNLSYAQHP